MSRGTLNHLKNDLRQGWAKYCPWTESGLPGNLIRPVSKRPPINCTLPGPQLSLLHSYEAHGHLGSMLCSHTHVGERPSSSPRQHTASRQGHCCCCQRNCSAPPAPPHIPVPAFQEALGGKEKLQLSGSAEPTPIEVAHTHRGGQSTGWSGSITWDSLWLKCSSQDSHATRGKSCMIKLAAFATSCCDVQLLGLRLCQKCSREPCFLFPSNVPGAACDGREWSQAAGSITWGSLLVVYSSGQVLGAALEMRGALRNGHRVAWPSSLPTHAAPRNGQSCVLLWDSACMGHELSLTSPHTPTTTPHALHPHSHTFHNPTPP